MPLLPLALPTIQNWSCHNCGGCCTQHLIEITDAERQRILDQKWTAADGVAQPPVVWFAGPPWNKRYRLAHRPDGGCVFLDDRGLCRIHAKFGESAKPLACRVYPYALHPRGKQIAVSLRFSCPSVIANKGKPVGQQSGDLKAIEALVVPEHADRIPPPKLTPRERIAWPEFLKVVDALDGLLAESRVPLLVRVIRALAWVNLIGQSQFQGLSGRQLTEFLDLVTGAVQLEFTKLPEPMEEPSRVGRLYFRLSAAQYARKDTVADLSAGLAGRWKLFRAVLRFSRGTGNAPPLQSGFQPVPFARLEQPFGGLPDGVDELFTRYLRVKVQGLHFCGPAYYGIPFGEGLHSLILVLPVTLWLARWKAASENRDQTTLADVQQGLAIADHHHGYSPALGQHQSRRRVRFLAESGDLSRLCVWYAR
uniref:YkgJ family cysteine cluster protein n=1 Tax=Schlesneria paludicola TaxID=360056 RepID=A0A7C2JZA4_9PLAN